jgi:hypothetical protein
MGCMLGIISVRLNIEAWAFDAVSEEKQNNDNGFDSDLTTNDMLHDPSLFLPICLSLTPGIWEWSNLAVRLVSAYGICISMLETPVIPNRNDLENLEIYLGLGSIRELE